MGLGLVGLVGVNANRVNGRVLELECARVHIKHMPTFP